MGTRQGTVDTYFVKNIMKDLSSRRGDRTAWKTSFSKTWGVGEHHCFDKVFGGWTGSGPISLQIESKVQRILAENEEREVRARKNC